jgi:hypothetical protein
MTDCGANCNVDKACYMPIAPLSYDLSLNRAARFHSDEMLRQGYFAHDSICQVVSNINSIYPSTCNGAANCACVGGVTAACPPAAGCTDTFTRISLFGAFGSGEIIASSTDPNTNFYLWLYEPGTDATCTFTLDKGHRWNILESTGAFGGGAAGGAQVGDFGAGAAPAKIPSGSHYPRQAASVDIWANWFDTLPPSVERVNVDGVCTAMTVGRGSGGNAAYTATLANVAAGCHRYYFYFKDSTNAAVTYPTTGSLGIGPAGSCADWDTSRPATCVVIFALTAVKSRKTHGAPGSFDLTIDATQPIGGTVTVEPRNIGSGHTIVFQFNDTVTSTGTVTTTAGAASATFAGSEVLVTLTGVADVSRATVSLANVNGAGVNASASIGFLVGDVNNSRSVTATDILQVKGRSGQATDATNFEFDLNASGSVTASDILAVKGRSGLVLP